MNKTLDKLDKFLNHSEGTLISIIKELENANYNILINCFSFLKTWISNPLNRNKKTSFLAFYFFGLIWKRVPLNVLLYKNSSFKIGIRYLWFHFFEIYQYFNQKSFIFKKNRLPFLVNGEFIVPSNSYQYISKDFLLNMEELPPEIENNSSFQNACIKYFRQLIINHVHINVFHPLLESKNSRILLTNTIINLLKELNDERDATQEELIFAFSNVLLYVNAFTLSNQIDGQILCEFIQSLPFISPFLILAMINNIPTTMYIFNLLIPTETKTEEGKDIQKYKYHMIDLSSTDNLTGFVTKIPAILINYFMTSSINEDDHYNNKDDNEFLAYIHLSSASLYNKMKTALSIAHERKLGPLHVTVMGILLLRCITFSLQRTLNDCAETRMFTPNFCNFVKTVFSILSTAFSEQLSQKFFDLSIRDPRLIDLSIRGASILLTPCILNQPSNNNIMKFCLYAMDYYESYRSAHLLISKLLQCEQPKFNHDIIDSFNKSNDLFALIDFVESIFNILYIDTFKRQKEMIEIAENIINRFGIQISFQNSIFLVDSINYTKTNINEESSKFINEFSQMKSNSSIRICSYFNCSNINAPIIYKLISLTRTFTNFEYADFIVNQLCILLEKTTQLEEEKVKLMLRPCDYALPLAQSLVSRLLVFQFYELALKVLQSMIPVLIDDPAPLHWIVSFTTKYRHLLTSQIAEYLKSVVSKLKFGNEFFFYEDEQMFYKIGQLLISKENLLIHDPEEINNEYQSVYLHATAFCHCSISLSSYHHDYIAEQLLYPLNNIKSVVKNRDKVLLVFAKLSAQLHKDIAISYFSKIVHSKYWKSTISAGATFMKLIPLETFKYICKNLKLHINSNNLKYFLQIIQPSFYRFDGNAKLVSDFINNILLLINVNSDEETQQLCIEVSCFLYARFDLSSNKDMFIQNSQNLNSKNKFLFKSILDFYDIKQKENF